MTQTQKVLALEGYCDNKGAKCEECELLKKYDKETNEWTDEYACVFSDMSDEMLDKCYNWYKELDLGPCENAEAKCCEVEPDNDMVNHPKNIVEEMRHLFDLFDNNVEISINKLNKMVNIRIQM